MCVVGRGVSQGPGGPGGSLSVCPAAEVSPFQEPSKASESHCLPFADLQRLRVLPGCRQPGQWPLISRKCVLRSGGRSQQGQGTQTERESSVWAGTELLPGHGWTLAHRELACGGHPSNGGKASRVQGLKSCSFTGSLETVPQGGSVHPHFTDEETGPGVTSLGQGPKKGARAGLSVSNPTPPSPPGPGYPQGLLPSPEAHALLA